MRRAWFSVILFGCIAASGCASARSVCASFGVGAKKASLGTIVLQTRSWPTSAGAFGLEHLEGPFDDLACCGSSGPCGSGIADARFCAGISVYRVGPKDWRPSGPQEDTYETCYAYVRDDGVVAKALVVSSSAPE